jgi:5-methylcytosine-specific restriction endonuclease McrA
MKTCSTCKEHKPLDQFSKDRTQPGGLNYQCRSCRSTVNKAKYRETKDITIAEQECSGCLVVKASNEFYRDGRFKHGIMSRCKKCHMKATMSSRTKEQQLLSSKRYRQNHPDRVREINRRTKALRRRNERKLWTAKDWDRLVARFDGCCAYCGEKKELTLDHVVPVSRGGRHAAGNFLPACRSCNSSKSSKLLVEWKAA